MSTLDNPSDAAIAVMDYYLDLMEQRFLKRYENDIKCAAKTKFDTNKRYAEIAGRPAYNGDYIWLTVNFMLEIEPALIVKKSKKAFNKRWIHNAIWSLEQRSEGDLPYTGYHVHAVIKKGSKSPSDACRELKNTFRTICSTDNPACFYIRYLDEDDAKDRVQYLLGNKKDEKQSKVDKDKQMREDFGYPQYWSHALPPSLLGNA